MCIPITEALSNPGEAAAANLHPIATATQVDHILRAAACTARVSELRTGAAEIGSLTRVASEPVPAALAGLPGSRGSWPTST